MPRFSVIMPVLDRDDELRRALDSLQNQTFDDFECIVIDDNSTLDILKIVDLYDDRFRYIRSNENLGPSGARTIGYREMIGDNMFRLDSDNELFPWALSRADHFLESRPDVMGVSGLFVFPDGLRVRVGPGTRTLTPSDYAAGVRSPYDMVGVVRSQVVREWLEKDDSYFSAEFHLWLTYHMRHTHLAVDEPWGRYHEGYGARVTTSGDARKRSDSSIFVSEHRPLFGNEHCIPLDEFLADEWARLARARDPRQQEVLAWMQERGVTRTQSIRRKLRTRLAMRHAGQYEL